MPNIRSFCTQDMKGNDIANTTNPLGDKWMRTRLLINSSV